MKNNNDMLLYHLLFGGKIKDLEEQFDISKSSIHRILDAAKNNGLYDWTENKKGELTQKLIKEYGENIIKYILDLTGTSLIAEDAEPTIVEVNHDKCKKVVALPDIHFPMNINLSAIEKFLADYQPDVLIYLGDLLELDYLSFFQKDNKLIVGNKLREEYNKVMKLMDKHIALSKASEVYFIEGNHEYRVKRFLKSYPAGTGFIEIPIAMKLEEKGIKWIELNKWVRLGHLFFTHGLYYNVYHARKHVDSYQRNIIYGHTHAWQVHSGIHPFDKELPHVAKSVGCLCNLNPTYMKNRPNQWINSFYFAEMEKDGTFFDNVVPMIKGNFRIPGLTSKKYECS